MSLISTSLGAVVSFSFKTDDIAFGKDRHGTGNGDLLVSVHNIALCFAGRVAIELAAFHNGFNIGGNLLFGTFLFGNTGKGHHRITVTDDDDNSSTSVFYGNTDDGSHILTIGGDNNGCVKSGNWPLDSLRDAEVFSGIN